MNDVKGVEMDFIFTLSFSNVATCPISK